MVQNGDGWRKAMVPGKEDKRPLAGSMRKVHVPRQESGLAGELGQTPGCQ